MAFIKGVENKIKMDIRILQQMKEQLDLMKNARVHVGIFADKNRVGEDGVSLTEVAFKNEFGFIATGWREDGTIGDVFVQPRSFLVMPIQTGIHIIVGKVKALFSPAVQAGKLKGWLTKLGISAEARIAEAFISSGFGTWEPNTDWTVKMKGSDMPLINKGHLRRSIASRVVTK